MLLHSFVCFVCFLDRCNQGCNAYTALFHTVPVSQGNRIIFQCLVVNGNTVRSSNFVHSAISTPDGTTDIEESREVISQFLLKLGSKFGDSIFLNQGGENCNCDRGGNVRVEVQNCPYIASLKVSSSYASLRAINTLRVNPAEVSTT